MSDNELVERFERLSLPENGFRHQDHVRLARAYLRKFPVLEVLDRLSAGLASLARAGGQPGRYHVTVTWAYVFLIHERLARARPDQEWEEFVSENPDLCAPDGNALACYYREMTLQTDLARQIFLLPDRGIVPT